MLSDGVAFCRAGAGAPVVLLHGVGLRAECWLSQIRVLQRTHRVFAADLPGHGESACLSSSRPVLADFVDKIGAFVKSAVRSPAVFVGHSAGALLAFSLAARFPELCRGVAALNAVYRRRPAAREAVRARAKLLQKFAHLPKTESGKSGAGVELSPKCALNNANAESEYAANVETTLRRWFGENPAGCGEKNGGAVQIVAEFRRLSRVCCVISRFCRRGRTGGRGVVGVAHSRFVFDRRARYEFYARNGGGDGESGTARAGGCY